MTICAPLIKRELAFKKRLQSHCTQIGLGLKQEYLAINLDTTIYLNLR
jgi:hypothetical protein